MPIAVFGNKSFSVSSKKVNTFNEFVWGGAISTEVQEKLNSKPSTYIKGAELDTMSFVLNLKSSLGHNVRSEIEDWENIKLDAKPFLFILGTKPLGDNKWLLKSTNISDTVINNKGQMSEAVLSLSFEEYVRQGSGTSSKKKKSTSTKAPAIAVNMKADDYISKPTNKSDNKRSNPNANLAVSKGSKKL